MFNGNIFTPLCSKSETSGHAQLAIALLCILLTNLLTWYQLKAYIKDTP